MGSTCSSYRVLVSGTPTVKTVNFNTKTSECDADSAFMILFDQFVYYLVLVLKSLVRVKPLHVCNTWTILPLVGLMEVLVGIPGPGQIIRKKEHKA